jgi:hypothetical protein
MCSPTPPETKEQAVPGMSDGHVLAFTVSRAGGRKLVSIFGRKCKGSERREGTRVGGRVCRCALSPRSRLTLVSLSSHSHLTLIALSSRSHITLISLSSHSHLALISLSSHSSHFHLTLNSLSTRCHFALISLSSHSHLALISFLSHTHRALISLSSYFRRTFISLSSHSHLTPISLSFHSHLIMACSFIFWGVVWAMTQHRNTHILSTSIGTSTSTSPPAGVWRDGGASRSLRMLARLQQVPAAVEGTRANCLGSRRAPAWMHLVADPKHLTI